LAETISGPDLAALLNLSISKITDLARHGMLVRAKRGQYELQRSVAQYVTHLREVAAGRGGEAVGATLASERTRLAREQADAQALKNRKAKGEMLDAIEVEREWIEVLRLVRAGMLAVPTRVQQRLPHLTTHDVAEIDLEVRDVLKEIADDKHAA
jgi:terminase small subunit / prophage DNA-packing protein